MPLHEFLTTAEIKALFAEAITAAGGTIADTFDDGDRLFTRALLPPMREVQRADRVQGGVALRATAEEVWVHPYVFRLVCRNGAIIAQVIQTRHLEGQEFASAAEAAEALREAVQACCAEDAFAHATEKMRLSRNSPVETALNLLSFFSRLPAEAGAQAVRAIMDRFEQGADRSRFALLNAITSVARDMRDPEVRWDLEELGGEILADRSYVPGDTAARMALVG
jgi:hypothetical protein